MRAPEGSSVPLTEALRAKRLAEADTPLERKMIFLANAVVVVCIVVVALVFMLSRLPDPQPKKAARAKKPALGKDGRYTVADVAKHAAEARAALLAAQPHVSEKILSVVAGRRLDNHQRRCVRRHVVCGRTPRRAGDTAARRVR